MLDLTLRVPRHMSLSETSEGLGVSVCAVRYNRDGLVLDGVDLEVEPTEMVAIVADDDELRALLVDLLRGLAVPDQGSIMIEGRDLKELASDERPPVVGPDHRQPPLTVIQRLLDSDDPVLDCLGPLPPTSDTELKADEQRRLAFAAAVASNPDLIILDEPTADVKGTEERQLIRTIEAVCHGRAAIVFTHRLSLARKASRVLVLEKGRLVPYRGHGPANHSDVWETRIPPVIEADPSLRLVQADETRPEAPRRMPTALTVGDQVGDRYQLCAIVGRNVCTETWKAQDRATNEAVRLKIPRIQSPDLGSDHPFRFEAWEQLQREHDLVQTLGHPGTAQVLDADLDHDVPYVVFEYVTGPSLADALDQSTNGLELIDVLKLGFDIAEILHHLHRHNLVHLNLRTGHVHYRGQSVVVTDFSQCRPRAALLPAPQSPPPRTRPLQGPGSLRPVRHYAPELRPGGIADPKIDIYALGVLLRKAACGSDAAALLPFAETRPDAPKAMANLIDAMTAIEPDRRPNGAAVMAHLRRCFPTPPTVNLGSTPPPRSPQLRLVTASSG